MDLLFKLTDAITKQYPKDYSCPSLTISKLKTGKYYYSAIRYPRNDLNSKIIVVSWIDVDFYKGLHEISQRWLRLVSEQLPAHLLLLSDVVLANSPAKNAEVPF